MSDQAQDRNKEELLAQIRKNASEEKAKAEQQGEERVAKIRERTDREKVRIEREADRRLEQELATSRDRSVGTARMEGRAARSRIKRELLDSVFDRASEQTRGLLVSKHYESVFRALVREVVGEFQQAGTIEVASQDVELAKSALGSAVGTWQVTAGGSERGHIVARSQDGLKVVDNSLMTRLERAKFLRASIVAEHLYTNG